MDIKVTFDPPAGVLLYTLGQPRVGNAIFSDYVYSVLPNRYVRITHHNDVVVQVPPESFGFKHAGNEVWFKSSSYDGNFKECENFAGKPENDYCSRTLGIRNVGIIAHIYYYGMSFIGQCNKV